MSGNTTADETPNDWHDRRDRWNETYSKGVAEETAQRMKEMKRRMNTR